MLTSVTVNVLIYVLIQLETEGKRGEERRAAAGEYMMWRLSGSSFVNFLSGCCFIHVYARTVCGMCLICVCMCVC